LRNAAALRFILDRSSCDPDISVHILDDYIPNEILPASIYTEGRRPQVLIFYSPQYQNYDSIQIGRSHQIIILPFAPEKERILQLFYLLHELGHTGPRNIRAAAGQLTALLSGITGAVAIFLLIEWPAGLLLQLIFLCAIILSVSVPMLVSDFDPLAAEIEADHFAFVGLINLINPSGGDRAFAWLTKRDEDGKPRVARLIQMEANPIWDDSVLVPIDSKLDALANTLRHDVYASLRTTLRTSLDVTRRHAIEVGEATGFPPPSIMLSAAEGKRYKNWMPALEIFALISIATISAIISWFSQSRPEAISVGMVVLAFNMTITFWVLSSGYFYILLLGILSLADKASFAVMCKNVSACAPLFSITRFCLVGLVAFRACRLGRGQSI
jgi:hypothetical protein